VTERSVRREQLLDAADRIVRRDGTTASMAAIAAEAGITKPVLYRHFGDKEGLSAALADRYTSRLLDDLRAALAQGSGRRDRVERTVDAYLRAIDAAPQVYRFLLHSDDAVRVSRELRGFTGRLAETLADGIAAELGGTAGVRERAWAYGVVGLVQQAGDWWLDVQPCPREQLVGDLVDLVWGAYADA
jgi:AcrR family transcriptional regulator